MDLPVECAHLFVEHVDESAQRRDARRVRDRQVEGVELRGAAGPEHVPPGRQDPVLGHHRMQLRFQPRAQLHELRSIAHQLPQLPDRRRRDPRLGDPPEAKQVDEIVGVAFVVLHASLPPVQRRRCRQMQLAAELVEQIRRPVPPIGSPRESPPGSRPHPRPPPRGSRGRCRSAASTPPHPLRSCARSPTGDDADRSRRTVQT